MQNEAIAVFAIAVDGTGQDVAALVLAIPLDYVFCGMRHMEAENPARRSSRIIGMEKRDESEGESDGPTHPLLEGSVDIGASKSTKSPIPAATVVHAPGCSQLSSRCKPSTSHSCVRRGRGLSIAITALVNGGLPR